MTGYSRSSKISAKLKQDQEQTRGMFIFAVSKVHETHTSLGHRRGTQCMPTCVVAARYRILKNLEEWVPQRIDEIILMGYSIANTLSNLGWSSFKIPIDLGSVLQFAIENMDNQLYSVNQSVFTIKKRKSIKFRSHSGSVNRFYGFRCRHRKVLLSKANACYFLFECHADRKFNRYRTSNQGICDKLQRTGSD